MKKLITYTIILLTIFSCQKSDVQYEKFDDELKEHYLKNGLKTGNAVTLKTSNGEINTPLTDTDNDGEGDGLDLNGDGNLDIAFLKTGRSFEAANNFFIALDFNNDGNADYHLHVNIIESGKDIRIVITSNSSSKAPDFLVNSSNTITGIDKDGDGASDDGSLNNVMISNIVDDNDSSTMTDAEIVDADSSALEIGFAVGDSASSVTQSISLPTTGENGSTITWESDNTAVITNDGTVTRPSYGDGDKTVMLTASISKGSENIMSAMLVTVKEASLTVTGANKTITVSWDAVTGADSYNLYWGSSSGVTTSSGTKIEGVTSPYEHTGLTNGTDYYYIITAVSSSGGESAASSEATAYPYLRPLKTYQTQCYDTNGNVINCAGTGQDGEYQKGREADFTGPTQHSTYTNDYTTTDNATGLVWKSCTEGQTGSGCQGTGSSGNNYGADNAEETWASAKTACTDLNSANSGAGYAGRTDWRLPEVAELETIINYSTYDPAAFSAGFPATVAHYTWSASTSVPGITEAWNVSFYGGGVHHYSKANSDYVRCVAGSFNQSSVYTDNGDGTVTDKGSGLIWQQCSAGLSGTDCATGSAGTYTWVNALSYCNNLTLAGKTWRLPNVNELKSIVDRTKASGARIDLTAFPATVAGDYWSASTYVPDTSKAWFVYFSNGNVNVSNKAFMPYVRCVADGP